MQCRTCGMESRTTDVCEWCRKPMGMAGPTQPTVAMPPLQTPSGGMPPGQPTMPMPPGLQPTIGMNPGVTRRVSLTGEVVEGPPPAPVMAPPPGVAHPGFIPPTAYTPQGVQEMLGAPQTALGERWEKFLALGLPLIALSLLLVHAFPSAFLWVAFANAFLLPLLMGAAGAIPSYDDAIADCGIVLIICFFFGPLIGLGAYLLVCLFKQECNGAMVALVVINMLIPQVLAFGVLNSDTIMPFILVGLFKMTSFFAICISFAGWLMSSFFRPLDE
jgi:hypothetical protein